MQIISSPATPSVLRVNTVTSPAATLQPQVAAGLAGSGGLLESSLPAVASVVSLSPLQSRLASPDVYSQASLGVAAYTLAKLNANNAGNAKPKGSAPFQASQGSTVAYSGKESPSRASQSSSQRQTGLNTNQQALIDALSRRDKEVRQHEQQHQSAGGGLAGSASFSFQTGPDGIQYAVSGEVPIEISTVPNDPAATISRMETVRAAALAPADPSPADRAVASVATQIIIYALAEQAARSLDEAKAASKKANSTQSEPSSTTRNFSVTTTTSVSSDSSSSKAVSSGVITISSRANAVQTTIGPSSTNSIAGSSSSNSASSQSIGIDLVNQANQIGSNILQGIEAYKNFIASQKNTGPLLLNQIV